MPRKKSEPAVEAQQITNDPLDSIEQKATAPPIVEERRATRAYSEDILDITDQELRFHAGGYRGCQMELSAWCNAPPSCAHRCCQWY